MIPYKPFAQHLQDHKVLATPAELHGHASGMIVMNNNLDVQHWVELVLQDYCFDSTNKSQLIAVLSALFDFAHDKLNAENFSFYPLLPADDSDLSLRLEALSAWCASFLTGLAFAGLRSDKNMPKEVHEFITDCEKISKVDCHAEGNQGEEADFVELVEYVKAGAILLFEEFRLDAKVSDLSH